MPGYNASRAEFAVSLTLNNWALSGLTAGDAAKVTQFHWGGGAVATIKYLTRWVRPTTAGATPTVITAGKDDDDSNAPNCEAVSAWTTEPIIPAAGVGDLYRTAWNAHGGLGFIVLPFRKEWRIVNGVGTAQLYCRNEVGADANASSYGLGWTEND